MSWFSELDRLQPLVDDLALLPVGWGNEGKGPMLTIKWGLEEQVCQCDPLRWRDGKSSELPLGLAHHIAFE